MAFLESPSTLALPRDYAILYMYFGTSIFDTLLPLDQVSLAPTHVSLSVHPKVGHNFKFPFHQHLWLNNKIHGTPYMWYIFGKGGCPIWY